MSLLYSAASRRKIESILFDQIENSVPAPEGLTYVTRQLNGRWQRRQMPEWYFQALFPDAYAQRREEVSVRVYQQLEPWGA